MEKKFKVGDEVIIRGILERNPDSSSSYPLTWRAADNTTITFTEDGKRFIGNSPILEHATPKERVVLVSNNGTDWRKRVLISAKNNRAICWDIVESLERAKEVNGTIVWNYWKELPIEEEVHLTLKDISEGKGVGVPPHLIRIKE